MSSETTEKKSKTTTVYALLVKFFKSRFVRNLTFTLLILFSISFMFMMDEGNYIRSKYLPFLDNNFVKDIAELLNVKPHNLTLGAWLIFFCIILVVVVVTVGSIIAPRFIEKQSAEKEKKFKSPKIAKLIFTLIFYAILLAIAAALIFVFIMAGGFERFNEYNQNIFAELLYAVILCLIFLLMIPIAVFALYYILKFIFFIVAIIASRITRMVKDIMAASELRRKKAQEELDEARLNAGLITEEKEEEVPPTPEPEKKNGKEIFPALIAIDNIGQKEPVVSTEISLKDLCLRFQSYAIKNKIYYELPLIRSYIAGLASSRLIILQGLSGTGKSMLPRMFSQFTKSNAFFAPVQATWRDKTDLLGFYSEFTKTFKSTDFLTDLYSISYNDNINEMVLDELNLSRIEYYFADFLSILEYPTDQWKIKIYDPDIGEKLPAHLEKGYIKVPENTWFIGTANTDDSTYTITDKVYDRAIIVDFQEKFSPIESDFISDPIDLSAEKLAEMFDNAKADSEFALNQADFEKFFKLCEFTKEAFDIRFGNRIMVQIENFVPVYVALGGTKEEAIDFMFASKILRKLSGAYNDYTKDDLAKLSKLISETYGKGVFKETERLIFKITKRLV